MTKLIKPVMIDNIIRSGVVLKSRKAYKEISKLKLTNICAVRACDDRSSCTYYKPCTDISKCKLCFLNANNYLNVLKYIKQKDLKQKSNYLKKLQILREMPYKLLHHVIKYNVLFDYINSVEFFVGLYGDKPIEIMKNDLNILERNNKIFKFKPY